MDRINEKLNLPIGEILGFIDCNLKSLEKSIYLTKDDICIKIK